MTNSLRDRRWTCARLGIAGLATVLLISGAGCGSRASDTEIAAAIQGSATGTAAPAGIAGDLGTAADLSAPAAGADTAAGVQAPGAAAASSSGATTGNAGAAPATAESGGKGVSGQANPGAAGAAAARPTVADKSVVKIGTIGPYSGVLGAIFANGPKTVAAWATSINAQGGLNGHPVKVIVGDDQGDPATSQTLARRMVENDKILAMVGNINIFGFEQLQKYTEEKGIPLIGGDGVLPGWYTSSNAFPVTPPAVTQIVKGLNFLVQKGARKIAIFYCLEVSALCTYLTEETKKSEVGKYIVQTYQVSLVAPSYTSQCLRMKQAGIDTLYLMMDSAGAGRAIQNCATQGFKPTTMLLGLDATAEMPTTPALADALVPGATFPPVPSTVPAIQLYHRVLATYGPSIGHDGATSFAWSSAQMFGLAGKNLSENPTSAELFTGLWKVKNETLGGLIVPTTYAKGVGAQIKPCVFLWGVANSKWSAPQGLQPLC